ncbi:MAG: DNA polymerase III subunit chi [Betaproteobacteria bacterium]|nr:DNA polymerase III subunit chi [Betaproteobacteria bacterium]NBY05184.1 DNA polymerase III subunit chi [Betaproteobacteria bacterium]
MEVAFHFNVSDTTDYTCRWLRKAQSQGARVTVTGPRERLMEIDQQLWALSATAFVPHAWSDAPAEVLAASVIILCESLPHGTPRCDGILLNAWPDVPQAYAAFDRVVEIVGLSEPDRALARLRWKTYAQAQNTLTRHDVAQTTSTP